MHEWTSHTGDTLPFDATIGNRPYYSHTKSIQIKPKQKKENIKTKHILIMNQKQRHTSV